MRVDPKNSERCINAKYSRDDPRQIRITNSLASMICADAVPTNIINRPGFRHHINTMDPRYNLPHYTTFSRSVIPKLKSTVSAFQRKKIEKALKNESSMAFFSFTYYFFSMFEKNGGWTDGRTHPLIEMRGCI